MAKFRQSLATSCRLWLGWRCNRNCPEGEAKPWACLWLPFRLATESPYIGAACPAKPRAAAHSPSPQRCEAQRSPERKAHEVPQVCTKIVRENVCTKMGKARTRRGRSTSSRGSSRASGFGFPRGGAGGAGGAGGLPMQSVKPSREPLMAHRMPETRVRIALARRPASGWGYPTSVGFSLPYGQNPRVG